VILFLIKKGHGLFVSGFLIGLISADIRSSLTIWEMRSPSIQ